MCQQLNLSAGARYLAVEIFDKFMVAHVSSLYRQIRELSLKDQQKGWRDVEERISRQLPLRAVSCVQIASKLTSHSKVSRPGIGGCVAGLSGWNSFGGDCKCMVKNHALLMVRMSYEKIIGGLPTPSPRPVWTGLYWIR